MKLMVSGTRQGMTDRQKKAFEAFLGRRNKKGERITDFIHGDCIGADAEAHEIFKAYFNIPDPVSDEAFDRMLLTRTEGKGRFFVTEFPPEGKPIISIFPGRILGSPERAGKVPHILYPLMGALDRNLAMLNAADYLVAFPHTMQEQIRSGTWHAIRHARGKRIPAMVVLPEEGN